MIQEIWLCAYLSGPEQGTPIAWLVRSNAVRLGIMGLQFHEYATPSENNPF